MTETPHDRILTLSEEVCAHLWAVHSLAHEMMQDPDLESKTPASIKVLAHAATETVDDLRRALRDLPAPGDSVKQYELGWLDALRNVQHGLRGPMKSPVSPAAMRALQETLAAVQAGEANKEQTAA
jgi:hypothetical protein